MAFYPSGATVKGGLSTDSRKALVFKVERIITATTRRRLSTGPSPPALTWKPRPNFSLSVGPSYHLAVSPRANG